MLKVKIREAAKKDLFSILSLYAQPDMYGEGGISLKQAGLIFNKMKKYPNYKVYVAVIDGVVIGTFALLIMDNLANMGKSSGIVEDLVVHTDWQKKGIGRQMMQFAMQICRQNNCYKLVLSCNIKRKKAHNFYKNLGFKQHGYSFKVDF